MNLRLSQDMFKRLVDAVPEVKFELYSFKSTIKCKEMLEQDCWFENKVGKCIRAHSNEFIMGYRFSKTCECISPGVSFLFYTLS